MFSIENWDLMVVFIVQLLGRVLLFETPWTAARQASCPSPSPGGLVVLWNELMSDITVLQRVNVIFTFAIFFPVVAMLRYWASNFSRHWGWYLPSRLASWRTSFVPSVNRWPKSVKQSLLKEQKAYRGDKLFFSEVAHADLKILRSSLLHMESSLLRMEPT